MTLTTAPDRRAAASLNQKRPGTSLSYSPRLSVPPLERIVLDARSDSAPISKPPVRIFVGTEPAQSRAERVFVWSIEQVRDPARAYEIHLMKDLPGFRRRGWLTGFTNYRFAVPSLAGSQGRAIYNDVDQVYLADPAELFDTALDSHGYLSVNDRDTSVMLIDCARMAAIWTPEAARRQRRKILEAQARAVPGLWGSVDPAWNTHDHAYESRRELPAPKVLHFTTIHAQPWQPFPERYAYQASPAADVWFDLERQAEAAGYHPFRADRPTARYRGLCARLKESDAQENIAGVRSPTSHPSCTQAVERLIAETASRTILFPSFGLDACAPPSGDSDGHDGIVVEAYIPAAADRHPVRTADGVVSAHTLDFVPDEDVSWLLDDFFRRAQRFVSVSVSDSAHDLTLPDGDRLRARVRPVVWWRTHLDAASRRSPKLRWHLRLEAPTGQGHAGRDYTGGNLGRQPVVWVLTSHKPGHTTQAGGLADALGWPYTTKTLHFRGPTGVHKYLFGADRPTRRGLDVEKSDPLDPPWPDLVIAAGWRPGRVARWIQRESRGRTHLVLLGRIGSRPIEPTDVSVVCAHFRLPPHPRRIETVAPVTRIDPERLESAANTWRNQVETAPHPRIMLLVGGGTARHTLTPDQAGRLGAEVRTLAERLRGTVFATTSRRTGRSAVEALAAELGPPHSVYVWRPDRKDNPYLGYLALADVLIVTGESESMLAEAAATEKPMYIYPLPERPAGIVEQAKGWTLMRARSEGRNERGSPRPQRGVAYVCGRLIEWGIVQPRRDLHALHAALVERSAAVFFPPSVDACAPNGSLAIRPRPPLRELDSVAARVRGLLPFRVHP